MDKERAGLHLPYAEDVQSGIIFRQLVIQGKQLPDAAYATFPYYLASPLAHLSPDTSTRPTLHTLESRAQLALNDGSFYEWCAMAASVPEEGLTEGDRQMRQQLIALSQEPVPHAAAMIAARSYFTMMKALVGLYFRSGAALGASKSKQFAPMSDFFNSPQADLSWRNPNARKEIERTAGEAVFQAFTFGDSRHLSDSAETYTLEAIAHYLYHEKVRERRQTQGMLKALRHLSADLKESGRNSREIGRAITSTVR